MMLLGESDSAVLQKEEQSIGVPGWKRALDIAFVVVTAPISLLLGLLIALAIKITSPGPVLFRQERVGHRGKRFTCLKFRTMVHNADTGVHRAHLEGLIKSNGPMVKLDSTGDKRLIRGGLILRTFGLDELPQLLNVWRGEMSVVGPRPFIPYEHEKLELPHRDRCLTLPGLTGLWQVNGKNRRTFEEMINFDLHYVSHASLILDIKIMLLTIPALMRQAADLNRVRNFLSPKAARESGSRTREEAFPHPAR